MKISIVVLSILTLLTGTTIAQNFPERFKKLTESKDTAGTRALLSDWEKSNPNDPEFYVAAINFYFSTGRQEIIGLTNERPTTESQGYALQDSTGAVVAYLASTVGYNPEKINKVMHYANKAIQKFPDRLDIRFGKCFVLGQIEDYETFSTEIIKAVEYSKINKNNWLWTKNEKVEEPENFMLNTIQEYLSQLYNTEDDKLLENMKRIGDATIKSYPNKVEILSTTAVAHLLTNSFDMAISYLKMAEKINPKDYIVLNNIAQGYKMKGDKENAIKYYELTEKYGDEQAKKQARENIKELKKK